MDNNVRCQALFTNPQKLSTDLWGGELALSATFGRADRFKSGRRRKRIGESQVNESHLAYEGDSPHLSFSLNSLGQFIVQQVSQNALLTPGGPLRRWFILV